MLALVEQVPSDWRSAWQLLDGEAAAHLEHLPWHLGYDSALPHTANRDDVLAAADKLRDGLAGAGVRLVNIRSAALFPQPFNAGTERWGNKAEALSRWTLGLVAEALDGCPAEDVYVVCDKHGGRNFYGRLLQQHFPDYLIEVHGESLARSTYRWGPPERRVEVRFCAGGESYMPVAAASMVSKYLRGIGNAGPQRLFGASTFSTSRAHGRLSGRRFPRSNRISPALQQQLGIDDRDTVSASRG